jgi:V/A-type H+-transporting ATPase subunit C
MLDAASFEDAAKLLTDCGYEDMSNMDAKQIEESLEKHRSQIFDELGRFCPEKSLVDIFKIRYDYHNAKVILKAEAMNQDPNRLLSESGRIPGAKLLEIYNEDKRAMLPETLANAIAEAKSVLARTANPQLSDFVLDKAYFAELQALTAKLDNSFLKGYVALLIDSSNLRAVVRTLRMGKNQDFLSEVLVPGGNVGVERLANASDKDSLAALYAHTVLEKAGGLGAECLSGGSMTAFELACDNAVNTYLRGAKLISYGCEPVVAYMAAVEGDITAIRMILTGRLAGIAPQVIRERLRDMYA